MIYPSRSCGLDMIFRVDMWRGKGDSSHQFELVMYLWMEERWNRGESGWEGGGIGAIVYKSMLWR